MNQTTDSSRTGVRLGGRPFAGRGLRRGRRPGWRATTNCARPGRPTTWSATCCARARTRRAATAIAFLSSLQQRLGRTSRRCRRRCLSPPPRPRRRAAQRRGGQRAGVPLEAGGRRRVAGGGGGDRLELGRHVAAARASRRRNWRSSSAVQPARRSPAAAVAGSASRRRQRCACRRACMVGNGKPQVMLRDPRLDQLLEAHQQAGGASQMPSGFLRNATFEGPSR